MSSYLSVKGSLYIQDIEDGKTSNNIPSEIYSDYSANPSNIQFRQLQISDSVFMGISNVGTYFYMSSPSNISMTKTFNITSDGNVGIGNTNPTDDFHVEGETLVRGSAGMFDSASVSDNVYASNVINDGTLVIGNINHRIPSGTIALWEDSTNIPNGWEILNTSGTSFIRGTNTIGEINTNNTVDLSSDSFSSHNHNTDSNVFHTSDHNHFTAAEISTVSSVHNHTGDISSSSIESYSHTSYHPYSYKIRYGSASFLTLYPTFEGATNSYSFPLSEPHSHTHSMNSSYIQNTYDYNGHRHVFSGNTNNSEWSHNITYPTTSTNNSTNNNSYNIEPLYKSYVFIIKQ